MFIDVLANDSDPNGDTLTVVEVSAPAHGTAVVAAGTVEYTPGPDFHGTDRFTVEYTPEPDFHGTGWRCTRPTATGSTAAP